MIFKCDNIFILYNMNIDIYEYISYNNSQGILHQLFKFYIILQKSIIRICCNLLLLLNLHSFIVPTWPMHASSRQGKISMNRFSNQLDRDFPGAGAQTSGYRYENLKSISPGGKQSVARVVMKHRRISWESTKFH